MAVTMLAIPNPFPNGIDVTQRSIVVKGQLLPYNSTNPILLITQVSITSNVVTFTCANTLTGGGGQAVFVAGLFGALAFLNGGYTTTAATSTTFTAAKTASNLAATPTQALATLAPNYATGGLALGNFTSVRSGATAVIGGIGPLNTPNLLEVYGIGGSVTQTYQVNQNATTPLVLAFTNTAGAVAQSANAAALPADSIGFYAEYRKNGF